MHFSLVDAVLECSQDRIVTVKLVTSAEEYLRDHFPTFPILPGVMMLEAMVQAGRRLLTEQNPSNQRHVLGQVRALKYGAMVKPGDTLRVEIDIVKRDGDATTCKGKCLRIAAGERAEDPHETAASGRFVLRPIKLVTES